MIIILNYHERSITHAKHMEERFSRMGWTVVKLPHSSAKYHFHILSSTIAIAVKLAQSGQSVILSGWTNTKSSLTEIELDTLYLLLRRYGITLIDIDDPSLDPKLLIEYATDIHQQVPAWYQTVGHNYTGFPKAKILFVGDRHNHKHTRYAFPFHGNQASSDTLHRALRTAKFQFYGIMNAYDDEASDILANCLNYDPIIVALGRDAHRWLKSQITDPVLGEVPHPSWIRRFAANDFEKYAWQLRDECERIRMIKD